MIIYVEGDPDKTLAKVISNQGADIRRELGKSRVCSQLKSSHNCKGMIDEDPESLPEPYLTTLQEVNTGEGAAMHGLRVLYDNQNNNTLVLLCPKLEEWILLACKESRINIRQYNLPDNSEDLHSSLTLKHKHNMTDFERLLEALLVASSPRLRTLSRLLNG